MFLNVIADILRQSIGLDAGTIGRLALENAVRARMAACGVTELQSYEERLREAGGELTRLIERVVVPETWFFRVPAAFEALIRFVREEWLPGHPAGRLRVLSAPCSTGEEPYSIAMALLDAGLAAGRFRIDAMDVSGPALERARRAVYGRNSFRGGGNPGFRERFFSPVAEGFELCGRVRSAVKFSHGNLVAEEAPRDIGLHDVIFCRNVLIYFDWATQERVVRALARRLAPEGLLFTGPAETLITRAAGFRTMDFPGAFVCRQAGEREAAAGGVPPVRGAPPPGRRGRTAALPPPAAAEASPAAAAALSSLAGLPAARVPAAAGASRAAASGVSPAKADLDAVTGLANAGRLPEAFSMGEAYLRGQGPSAGAYYLLGLIRDTMGDPREAAALYRKALYLDPGHQETLLHLALLTEKQGDPEGARRLRLRARRAGEVPGR